MAASTDDGPEAPHDDGSDDPPGGRQGEPKDDLRSDEHDTRQNGSSDHGTPDGSPDETLISAEDVTPDEPPRAPADGSPDRPAGEPADEPPDEDLAEPGGERAGESPDEPVDEPVDAPPAEHRHGLLRALALTVASAAVWGVAHLATGRKAAGAVLLSLFLLLASGAAATAVIVRGDNTPRDVLQDLAVRPGWLTGVAVGALVLAVLWAGVVLRSYQIVRPARQRAAARIAGATAVIVLCAGVGAPLVWAARFTQVYRQTLTSISKTRAGSGRPIDRDNPWAGMKRVNVLLLGGDAAANRVGVRTDSMTLASIDTRTGDTVLISLPRNLENVPMPPGPARDRFPAGFTGDGPLNPGLLNEVYEYAENHPEIVPGVPRGQRGPELLKQTISGILGQPVDYYVLVDMFGFADIVDAVGGVELTVPQPIPYGTNGAVLAAGRRLLNGREALWYGRSRTLSDDYTRMGRQKCLMRAIAKQADPMRLVTGFEAVARAARRTISTDIPLALFPAFIKLSAKVKRGARINSLQFVPPLIYTGDPDYGLIRVLAARAIRQNGSTASPSPSALASSSPAPSSSASPAEAVGVPSGVPGGGHSTPESGDRLGGDGSPAPTGGTGTPATAGSASPSPSPAGRSGAVSLDAVCPS